MTVGELLEFLNQLPSDAVVTLGFINNPTQKLGWTYWYLNSFETAHVSDDETVVTLLAGEQE